jgi:hypothetical protein
MSKNRLFSIFCLGYWLSLIVFVILDTLGIFGTDVGFFGSLQTSSLARVMFMDIGALATVAAIWIIFNTKTKFKWLIALLTICFGSFILLPYLSWYFWE